MAPRVHMSAFPAIGLACWAIAAMPAQAQTVESLKGLSLEQLGEIEITSVSKQAEPLSGAAAAVYVVDHQDIMRSGATSIPEMLRLAPNLEVFQISPSQYDIAARGFSGNFADQNFSNKLLVMIDGRSVYNPLYSGVYWDMQDLMPEDIDRIEVISGPGATLWGANAVNGVINIITRNAADTQGGLLDLGVGNLESAASLQYGGKIGTDIAYRVYAKAFEQQAYDRASGSSARDGWSKPQGGFRLDWTPQDERVTVQGDIFQGDENQLGAPDTLISGGNLQATWLHPLAGGSTLQLLAYYDQTRLSTDNGGGAFILRTYDLEAQHNFSIGDRNDVVWGAGERVSAYSIDGRVGPATSLLFVPSSRTLNLADLFAEDHFSITPSLALIAGLKLEDDPYSHIAPMPSVRLSWTIDQSNTVWGAISRAVRAPTPFDRDVLEKLGPQPYLTGGDFQPETLTAYELGYRGDLGRKVTVSVSTFWNSYDDLKTVEYDPVTLLPLHWGNMIRGEVYGVEAWATYRIADWWRLDAGLTVQNESLRFKPGASGLLGVAQEGDDPHHRASLRSSIDIADGVTFDADLRYVGALPDPRVPDYAELNARLGWRVTDTLDVSISGFNLLHDKHREFVSPPADEIPRSFYLETRWRF